DLQALTQNYELAERYYDSAMQMKIGSAQFLLAYVRSILDTSDVGSLFHSYLFHAYNRVSNSDSIRMKLIDSMIARHRAIDGFDRVWLSIAYLRYAMARQQGHGFDKSYL